MLAVLWSIQIILAYLTYNALQTLGRVYIIALSVFCAGTQWASLRFDEPNQVLWLFLLPIVGAFGGAMLGRLFSERPAGSTIEIIYSQFSSQHRFFLTGCFLVGLIMFAFIAATIGIPITMPEIRSQISSYNTYIVALVWISTPYFLTYFDRKIAILMFVVSVLVSFCMAYRTPLMFLFICLFVINSRTNSKFFSKTKSTFFLAIGFLFIVLFANLRVNDNIISQYAFLFSALDLSIMWLPFAPLFAIFFETSEVAHTLVRIIPENGHMMGAFTLSTVQTILPGDQIHPRALLSFWMGRENWETSTTTPGLVGQAFIEFGYPGVLVLFISIFYFIISMERRTMFRARILAFHAGIWAVLFTSITTGILDILFLMLIGHMVSMKFILIKE